MEAELIRRCLDYGAHFSAMSHVETLLFDMESSALCAPPAGRFCMGCTYERCVPCNTLSYGCSEAFRWGGKYIYYCPLGLVFCAAIVQDPAGRMLGGLLAGPVVMGLLEDTLMGLPQREMEEKVYTLPVFRRRRSTTSARSLPPVWPPSPAGSAPCSAISRNSSSTPSTR